MRTRDFWSQLDAKGVDLICGSVAAAPGRDPALADYDVIEWHREDLALITNLPVRELPIAAVGQDRLPEVPLLAPSAGLIVEFLRRWYGPDFTTRLRIVAEVDSIYYGLALLRSQLVHGALICARAAANAALEGRLPGGPGLRLVPLADDYKPPLQLLAGIFARKGERQLYDDTPPQSALGRLHLPCATLINMTVAVIAREQISIMCRACLAPHRRLHCLGGSPRHLRRGRDAQIDLTPDFVAKTQQATNPHLAIEALRKLLNEESTKTTHNNVVRKRPFSERLTEL
ncbi:MAG: type I restriction enzyme endonuclease domain-containing protein, partial [Pseudonocardiaceae bacterium]